MKSKSSPKKNRRTKRQKKSLQFESLEPRQMLTFFTPGVSDPALFDTVISVAGDASGGVFEDLGTQDETTQINLTDGGRIGAEEFEDAPRQLRIQDAELNITGGNIGDNVEFSGVEVNLSGGVVGDFLDVFNFSSVINVSGGTIGDELNLRGGGALNQTGGEIGDRFDTGGGNINISGGTIGSGLRIFRSDLANISGGVIGRGDGEAFISDSTVNISGGVINDRLIVREGSVVNLFVLEYQLDGQTQGSQVTGEAVTISDRDVTISGVLADGTPFSYGLFTGFQNDLFASEATLNVTLVDQTGIPNGPRIITGDLVAAARSDGFDVSISGDVDVNNTDGINEFIPQIITRGQFGDFSVSPRGGYTYEIDVAAVGTVFIGDSVSESFEVTAVDGTTESVTFTIHGTELPPPSQDSTITGDFSRSGLATDSTITGVVSVTDPDVGPIRIFDSASGVLTNSSQRLSTNFFAGLQFEVTSRTRIDEVGAFFSAFSPTGTITAFAAINRLTSLSDIPDSPDLTGSDLIFKTEFLVSEDDAVTLAPVTGLTLDPGFYSLSFGSDEIPDFGFLGLPRFVETGAPNRALFGFRQSDGSSFNSGGNGNARLIINGELDPINVSEVVPQSGIQGTYGVFNIDAIGNWNYVIDTAAVESLVSGEAVTEDFEIVSVDGTATETITVTVTVSGVNQAVTASDTTLEVFEDAVNGSILGTVVASDPDGDAPVISIVSGNEAGVFAVDATGNVTLADASQLDFDITPEYTLVFEASDGLTTDTATLIIGVIDVNQAAVISGDIAGTATEDRGVSGLLTISDTDGADEAAFQVEFIRATYGQIGIQADGSWRYTPFTTPVTQALRAGEIVSDTFTLTSVDGTTVDITILIEGVNDPANFPGTVPVQISEDATAPLTGLINVVDRDAEESEIIPSQQIGSYGVFEINAAGEYSYTVDNAAAQIGNAGFELDDFFLITSLDGSEQDFLVQVVGANDSATITGDFTGTIDEDAVNLIRGTLEISDPDFNESRANENPIVELGDFGTFRYSITGSWFYTVNNDAVADLNSTESVTDTFEVVSFDGTATASVTITIEGRNDYFDDAVTTDFGAPVTFNVFDNDQVAGDVVITSNRSAQGGDILIGADGNVTYTPSESASLNGTDSFQLIFEDENGNIARSNVTVTINPFVEPGDTSGFELVNVNDFFNPDSGSGGFIATYEFTVSEDSIIDGELFAWGIRSGYSGGGEIADVFLDGFNGPASRGPGSFDISNIDSGFRPELTVGDSFRVSFRINGAAFDSADFALTFVDSDPQRVLASASQVEISAAPTNDWGAGFVQNVSISNVSESAISGWSVILDVPEGDTFDLSNVWGATAETLANGDILFSGLSWNRDISADGSISFGFLGDNATRDAVVIDELDFALI